MSGFVRERKSFAALFDPDDGEGFDSAGLCVPGPKGLGIIASGR